MALSPYTAQNPGPWKHTATGRKWKTWAAHRMGSGSFDFDTFGDAVAYARQMHALNARYMREYGDLYGSFRAEITGPGGVLTWEEIRQLVEVAR